MTIAISLKIHDGIVLASDSASTFNLQNAGGGPSQVKVYNNANKIFNLRKGLPIGGMTWGLGNIGTSSIATLAKDLRQLFTSGDAEWPLNQSTYTMEQVATLARKHIFENHYQAVHAPGEKAPYLGFLVVGYSVGRPLPEEWLIEVRGGECGPPSRVGKEDHCGARWFGDPDPIQRLLLGTGMELPSVLASAGVPGDKVPDLMKVINEKLERQVLLPAMPIQDAIDLAEFLASTTVGLYRFTLGAQTVGGPVEVAAITKHEGFKWVKRKHYFDSELNPLPRSEV